MNRKQYQYVLTLAREGSFSRAAEALNITQPSFSQYMKKIESEVGFALFDRTGGSVRVTDAGQVYLETARKILDLEHQMENALSDLMQHKTGSLILGAAPYRSAGMMPTVARAFQRLHPGMHLVVREGTTAELREGLEHGEYDLALTLLPVDERLFAWEKVAEEELVLAVPGEEPPLPAIKAEGRRYPAVDAVLMNGRPFVRLTEAQFMEKQLENLCLAQHLELGTAAVVKSLEAQIAMVRAGVGPALVPTGIERFCAPGEVNFYSFLQDLSRREVGVVWRKDRRLSAAAEELKAVLCGINW